MSSKRIEHIYDVCKHIKDTILTELDAGNEVIIESADDIRPYACRAFKDVAKQKKIKESTVRSACTNGIGLDAKTFYDMVKNRLISKDKAGDHLIGRMDSYGTKKDYRVDIEKLMDNIF